MSRPRPGRRAVALALAVVGVAGLGVASASQLTVGSSSLQAGSTAIGGCQPATQAVSAAFTSTFSAATSQYVTAQVVLGNVAGACAGATYRLQLTTTTGTAIDLNGAAAGTDLTGTVGAGGGTVTVAIPSTAVATIGGVSVLLQA